MLVGFRPRRRAQDAIAEIHYLASGSPAYHWVFEGDITACLDALSACFSAIPHDKLMQAVEERISDRTVLALLQAMLRAGVLEDGRVRREVTGTPQGGPLSPLLCNVYLHRLDRVWDTREHGVLVRYCDDLVVMCSTRRQAEDALARLTTVLARLGLELKAAKTRIVHLTEDKDAEGFDFLGFHHRWVRAQGKVKPSRVCFLARWPSRKAAQHARDRIRQITDRKRLLLPNEWIVGDSRSCAAGAGISATGTPPGCSMRSASTPWNGWPGSWASATNAAVSGA